MKTDYLLRSLLFVPGHNEKLMNSATKSDADVLLLDLEDSVQPKTNKQSARDTIISFVNEKRFSNHYIFPRINDRESGELLKDVDQLTIDGVHGFMYPKSKTGEDVYFIDKLLETIEYEKEFPIGTFKLIPLIETSSAVLHTEEICKASERVIAVAFGSEDFIGDLEGIHDKESESLFNPRALIAMGARASNVVPIDTVHIRVHDLEDLEKNVITAKNLGFEGMLCLHPKELELVHKYYSPTEEEVKHARDVLELNKQAEKEGRGVAIIDGKFIGPPILISARKTLQKHDLILKKNNNG
ncbi:MAG: HpcH/HpaI aldolase/citrate lyase family protein [bacterium]